MIKLIETFRDGFQGIKKSIPISKKVDYINNLLKVGFDAVDIGAFISYKIIPQMADTAKIIDELDLSKTQSKIMVLVGNKKGAEIAAGFEKIDHFIYPFSISQTFLKKNINSDFQKSEKIIDDIVEVCSKNKKEPIIYLSMAFGNPYGDPWNLNIVHGWIEKLISKGIKTIPLSDITGEATFEKIKLVYNSIIPLYPLVEFRLHLHTQLNDWYEKIDSAYKAGCKSFDSVLGGIGGCPLTGYKLLSNINTINLMSYFDKHAIHTKINRNQLNICNQFIKNLF